MSDMGWPGSDDGDDGRGKRVSIARTGAKKKNVRKKGTKLGKRASKNDLLPNYQSTPCLTPGCANRRLAGRKYCDGHFTERMEARDLERTVAKAPVRTRQRSKGALSD
jgi:hypothetical protein